MSADVAANGATVVLLVNEPVFNALRAKGVIAGTCNAPNLQQIVSKVLQSPRVARTVWLLLRVSMHKGHTSSPASAVATGAQ